MRIGRTGFLELKSIRLGVLIGECLEGINKKGNNVGLFNWQKELAPVLVIRELAHKKELKVRPTSLVEQTLRAVDSENSNKKSWLLILEFDKFESIGIISLTSVSLLQPNIESKLYINESYVDKAIEEECKAVFDLNGSMVNYDIELIVDKSTKELYEQVI